MEEQNSPASNGKWKRLFKRTYSISVHLLALFALGLIAVAVAVKFRWTNQSGLVDVNNRYFNGLSEKNNGSREGQSSKKNRSCCKNLAY
jgi:hypothetical protein